jgi:hypothetical protein
LHAEQKYLEYDDEDSEVDTDETDGESEGMEDDLVDNLLSRQVGGGNGLIKQNIAMHEDNILTQTHEAGDSFKPQAHNTSSAAHKSSARRVSFADEKTPKINEDNDSDSSTESLRIEFKHTPVDSQVQESRMSDEHPIKTPADIHKHIRELMSKHRAPKPILKKSPDLGSSSNDIRSQRMHWLSQPDSVPIITQEIEEPLWNSAAQQPVQFEERPVVIT